MEGQVRKQVHQLLFCLHYSKNDGDAQGSIHVSTMARGQRKSENEQNGGGIGYAKMCYVSDFSED